jgi:hypothetical protein
MKKRKFPDDPWFYASYEGARIAALLKTCDLPFSEKLDFIDQSFRLFSDKERGMLRTAMTPRVEEASE